MSPQGSGLGVQKEQGQEPACGAGQHTPPLQLHLPRAAHQNHPPPSTPQTPRHPGLPTGGGRDPHLWGGYEAPDFVTFPGWFCAQSGLKNTIYFLCPKSRLQVLGSGSPHLILRIGEPPLLKHGFPGVSLEGLIQSVWVKTKKHALLRSSAST